nr:hypothetical protein [Paenibacillus roseus]
MNPQERDAWVATEVMGWRKVSRPGGGGGYVGWQDETGRVVAIENDCTMHTGPSDWFRPSRNIKSAWIIVEKSREWGGIEMGCFSSWNTVNTYDRASRPVQVTNDSAAEAICLAAIIARCSDICVE